MSLERGQFSSKIGFILAAAGSAVGLGNLVAFPVAATKNGGGAFLLMYAIFVVAICLPLMIAELSLGRNTCRNPFGAFKELSNNSPIWKFFGMFMMITPFMIGVFYTVVTVWIVGYLFEIVTGNLDVLSQAETFGQFINSPDVFLYMAIVFAMVKLILVGGVKDGIERLAKFLMPALFVLLIALMVYVLTLENAFLGVKYYLIPDISKITLPVISGALSQAFFSLSLGMGILITYGSYLRKQDDISKSAFSVAMTDSGVAFLAGLMILPAIFSFNPETDTSQLTSSSVGMIFVFLPKIFLALQADIGYFGASLIAGIFFILVLFAAITSLVSIIEVPVAGFIDNRGYPRDKALLIVGELMAALTVIAALSFGMSQFFTEFVSYAGKVKSFFDILENVFYDTILPINGLIVCIFVMYRWKQANFNAEMETGGEGIAGTWMQKYVNISLMTFIPVILALVAISTIALKFFGVNLLA